MTAPGHVEWVEGAGAVRFTDDVRLAAILAEGNLEEASAYFSEKRPDEARQWADLTTARALVLRHEFAQALPLLRSLAFYFTDNSDIDEDSYGCPIPGDEMVAGQ